MDKQKAIEVIKDAPADCEYSKLEILKIEEGGDMKYPAILKSKSKSRHQLVLAYSPYLALHIEGEFTGEISRYYDVGNTVNITPEYLQNTYGEVLSPEHAEFIIELAKNAGFVIGASSSDPMVFEFSGNSINTYSIEPEVFAYNDESKQITIPLPPKFNKTSKVINPSNIDVKLSKPEPLKNAGDNLILGCEDSKCDEWPQVGSTVTWGSGHAGEVKSLSDEFAWVKRSDNSQYITLYVSSLSKPKTPEEELQEWMQERIGNGIANGFDCEQITHDLLHHLNITKKPQ